VQKYEAPDISCLNTTCNDEDTETCCNKEGHCSIFQCPEHLALRNDADDIMCEDVNCTDMDDYACCGDQASR
jgi:hypothetical protein